MKKTSLILIALVSLPLALATAKTPDRFEQADKNHDGKLTRAEWMAGSNDSAKAEAFRVRDANADGVVTMDEALAYGRKKGMAKELLEKADTNKDGKLSIAEIKAYYASKEGPVR